MALEDVDMDELVELRASRWRMSHELQSLRDTVEVLRVGANSLAIDNAMLKIQNQHLRTCAQAASLRARSREPTNLASDRRRS